MSLATDTLVDEASRPLISQGTARDFYELLKPRVMQLVIFTALVGMMSAPVPVNPVIGFASLLAIAIGAGASGCLNMWYDASIDAVMERTSKRPIPSGAIAPGEAFAFGMTLSVGSVLFLGLIANWYAAAFLAFTIFFYVVIYTMWLKHWTVQNIVIGGAAGAFPPMIGYMAVTGSFSLETFLHFLIIFVWTPPHFWALALVKSQDYARAGVPMLPVIAGGHETRRQILYYSIALWPVGMAPALFGFTSFVYLVISALGGAIMLYLAYDLYRIGDGEMARKASYRLFGTSILYLFGLFAALLGEEIAPLVPWASLFGGVFR
jgi:protoheme IX farnesyltransferase